MADGRDGRRREPRILRDRELCPLCGEVRLDSGHTLGLVQWLHATQLAELGILVDGGDAQTLYGNHYAGPGYLLTGAASVRATVDVQVGRLLRAVREERALVGGRPGQDDPICLVVAPASLLVSESVKAARRGGKDEY